MSLVAEHLLETPDFDCHSQLQRPGAWSSPWGRSFLSTNPSAFHEAFQYTWNQCINNSLLAPNENTQVLILGLELGPGST